ncbi:MAG: agmatinase [Chlamydiia bacterium]|nr:agmatinase [Chlamydiia bacterium]
MQGHGRENCYLGIDCSLEEAKVVILPVSFDQTTTYAQGTDKGPQALIEASRNLELYDIETGLEVSDEGIHTAPEVAVETSEEMLQTTYERVKQYLSEEKFVVTLGGEHAISYAPIQAHVEKFGSLSVLQFDAHADLIPAYQGNPYSHASVMSRVKKLPQIETIVSVGIRSMSKEEACELEGTHPFFAHTLEGDEWMDQVVEQLGEVVYITFDLDVFDSSLMPATGTPEPGGISWNTATKLLKKVIENKTVVGLDVVELCPIPGFHAPDFLAAKLVYKILSYIKEAARCTSQSS